MRAFVLSVVMLMSAVASAQTPAQGLARPPPPGQPTGPINTQPAPTAPVPGYNNNPQWDYDDYEFPQGFRRQGALVIVERDQLISRLARMEELLAQVSNESGNRRAREALSKIRQEMNGLRADVNNAPDLRVLRRRQGPPPAPPAPPQPQVSPISEPQLQNLMQAIQKESFGDGKLRVLEAAAPTQYFLVPQVMKVLQKFSFGEDKLDAVRLLWPRVLDRENSYQLYQSFSFPAEKEELKKIIGR
ncbi:DUF4476 domain-containing protein [Hyalangium minutum]|uniref:DUF4476 domain-containing protein n=1 Tax=Hyalangium minutum TaxID=394096 RepID=A0A085W5H0_9BACT|nr:DUF4476 domain-containing protein [Hyalangium minutum]KFE62933.1 hypothetical protein DB31_2992 [Hyalangium minutum]